MTELNYTYKTIGTPGVSLLKEKSSKFIGVAQSCFSISEVHEKIRLLKNDHPQASHFCYAYVLGVQKKQMRANDDGEPNNSAGTPILGQIQSFDLTNVLVVVIRYYGGTKLGVGGLVQAYKSAARTAISNSDLLEKEVGDFYILQFPYANLVELMNFIKRMRLYSETKQIADNCLLRIYLPLSKSKLILAEFSKIDGLHFTIEDLVKL